MLPHCENHHEAYLPECPGCQELAKQLSESIQRREEYEARQKEMERRCGIDPDIIEVEFFGEKRYRSRKAMQALVERLNQKKEFPYG